MKYKRGGIKVNKIYINGDKNTASILLVLKERWDSEVYMAEAVRIFISKIDKQCKR